MSFLLTSQSEDSLLSNRLNFPRPRRSTTSLIDSPRESASRCTPAHPASVTLIPRVFFGSSYRAEAPALERFAKERSLTRFAIYFNLRRTLHIDLSIKLMVYRIIASSHWSLATIYAPHVTSIRLKNHPLGYRKDHHICFSAFCLHTYHTGSGSPCCSTFGGSICRRKTFKSRAPPTTRISTIPK